MVIKRAQHVAFNNVGWCWSNMLTSFEQAFIQLTVWNSQGYPPCTISDYDTNCTVAKTWTWICKSCLSVCFLKETQLKFYGLLTALKFFCIQSILQKVILLYSIGILAVVLLQRWVAALQEQNTHGLSNLEVASTTKQNVLVFLHKWIQEIRRCDWFSLTRHSLYSPAGEYNSKNKFTNVRNWPPFYTNYGQRD